MCRKVVVGIVTKGGEVLLVRRKPGEGLLLWQFPGGTVEDGETDEQAVVRELREEASIAVRPSGKIGERVHPYTKRLMAYMACDYLGGEPNVTDDDLEDAEWVPTSALGDYFTTPLYDKVALHLAGARGMA